MEVKRYLAAIKCTLRHLRSKKRGPHCSDSFCRCNQTSFPLTHRSFIDLLMLVQLTGIFQTYKVSGPIYLIEKQGLRPQMSIYTYIFLQSLFIVFCCSHTKAKGYGFSLNIIFSWFIRKSVLVYIFGNFHYTPVIPRSPCTFLLVRDTFHKITQYKNSNY